MGRFSSFALRRVPEFCSDLGCCGIDYLLHRRDAVSRKAAALGVLANSLFIGSDVDAVDLIISHVTLDPLDFRAKLIEHAT